MQKKAVQKVLKRVYKAKNAANLGNNQIQSGLSNF